MGELHLGGRNCDGAYAGVEKLQKGKTNMRWSKKRWAILGLASGILLAQITGCGEKMEGISEEIKNTEQTKNAEQNNGSQHTDNRILVTADLKEGTKKEVSYEPEDLETQWDEEAAGKILLEETGITVEGAGVSVSGNAAVIREGGTFVVSGSMENGQIRMEAEKGELVRLVLKDVELSNDTTAPIYGEGKCKVVLTLAEGTKNIFQDGTDYQYENQGEDEPDGPVFTNGDLTINGLGELQVYGNYGSGIRSKDNLKVISGNIQIVSKEDGLKGRDSVVIRDGTLNIQAGKDGIKSNQDTEEEKGFIWIDGGAITIEAKDDGIQAETALIVNGGQIEITESQEGLAGKTVDIFGGTIKAKTMDDGINSAASVETEREKMQDQEGVYTRIAGGEVWLDTQADGIDSNGDLYIEGGAVYLSGPVSRRDGILDYNGMAEITGGTVFAAGTSGMMQTFGEKSSQNYLVVYWEESQEAGNTIRLMEEDGTILGEYGPPKAFDTAIISVPGLEDGKTYQVSTGEGENQTHEIKISGVETVSGTAGGREGGGGRPEGGRWPEGGRPEGGKPEGERWPEGGRPEGGKPEGEKWPEGGRPESREERWPERKRPEGGRRPEGGEPPVEESLPE